MISGQIMHLGGQEHDIPCRYCPSPMEKDDLYVLICHGGKLLGVAHLGCAEKFATSHTFIKATME